LAEQFPSLTPALSEWIEAQHLFFVASAAPSGQVNISPKGQDSLRILGPNEILWMNLTGSGNETAAHLLETNRMTIMWCAFEGAPRILRVYGSAQTIHPRDTAWDECCDLLPPILGTRQYYRMQIDLVQTSCGYAVPFMDFREERTALTLWAEKRGTDGVNQYWAEKNQLSIDGFKTGIFDEP